MDKAFYLSVIAPYLNFALFIFLAYKFLKKPLVSMFANQKIDFEKKLKEADSAKEIALKQNQELQAKLTELEKEIEEIKSKAISSSEYESNEIVNRANKLAENMKLEAVKIREMELKKAKEALKKQIVSEVKLVVLQKLENDLDADQKNKMIRTNISQLRSIKGEKK